MQRHIGIALLALALAGCQTTPEIEVTPPPTVVRVPVEKFIKLPAWATRQLPEDAPKESSTEEAVRLSCVRLETIRYANCRSRLLDKLDGGEPVDPKACDAVLAKAKSCRYKADPPGGAK